MALRVDTTRDLLFGLLSLQVGLIEQGDLFAAFNAWSRGKGTPLSDVLVAQGSLDLEQRGLIDSLVAMHLKRHGDDPEQSLAALGSKPALRARLADLGDHDLNASLGGIGEVETGLESGGNRDPMLGVSLTAPMAGGGEATGEFSVQGATSFGRFRLLRPHARGGLGVVFVALDQEFQREFALKQIQERYAHDTVSRARFVREAEVTGGLEHPGIVPVYCLGSDDEGRPFYAMRFIRGETLKEALVRFHAANDLERDPGARALELRKLLSRFIDVCNAIDYAHGRGVMHRDLKPANIVVGNYGETLVVDWGLAKAVGHADPSRAPGERTIVPSTTSGSAETVQGSALGTPAYMSPEQAAGDLDRLGPRSDVYSLGATLYCVLTGRPPFDEVEVGLVLRSVQAGEFARPRSLASSLDPALESVCLKAMALAPQDRYDSARELADDLERWMADEPVSAYREPFSARSRRWLKRHRTGVSTAMAAAAVATACLGASTGLLLAAYREAQAQRSAALAASREAASQRDEARAGRDKARDRFLMAREAVDRFYTLVGDSEEMKAHGLELLRRDLLESAVEFYRRLAEQAAGDPEVGVERGRAFARLAMLSRDLDRNDEARSDFDQAAAIFERLANEYPQQPEYRRDLAQTLQQRGMMEHDIGRYVAALPAYRQSLDLRERLASDYPGEPRSRRDLAASLHSYARLQRDSGHLADSEPIYLRALSLRRRLAEEYPKAPEYQDDIAWTEFNLGNLYVRMGRNDQGEEAYLRCISLWEHLVETHPLVVTYSHILAGGYNNLGNLYASTGRLSPAQRLHRKAMAIHRRLVATHPHVPLYQEELAKGIHSLGMIDVETGHTERARAAFDDSIAIRRGLIESHPEVMQYSANQADTYSSRGDLEVAAGRPQAALEWYDRAGRQLGEVLRQEPNLVDGSNYLVGIHRGRARAWSDLNRPDDADRELRLAERADQGHGDKSVLVLRCLLLARAGERIRAAAQAGELACDRSLAGPLLFDLARVHALLASGTGAAGDEQKQQADAALELLDRARSLGLFQAKVAVSHLSHDPDFERLRGRPDYQALIKELAFPQNPFAD